MHLLKLLSVRKKAFFTVALLLAACGVYAQPSYCTSSLGGPTYDAVITDVAIPGTTLNNASSGLFTYDAFPISGSTTATLQQGETYTIVVDDSEGAGAIGMWVDFNQDGVFETYEWFNVSTDASGITTATFTVPFTAHTGVTGLRIRTEAAAYGPVLASDACTDFYYGETQDYYVTIDTTLPCSGTPAVGVINGPASICPGTDFTLSLTGYTIATGLTYQWYSHPASGGSYAVISGATNSTYTATESASTDFELKITCTASGLSSTSATFTESLTPAYMCYCNDSVALGGTSFYAPIDSVSIVGTTLNNWTPFNPATYSSYPASGSTTATLQQGGYYTVVVNATDVYDYPANVSMWIDYNHSGTFDPVEWTSVGVDVYGNAVAAFTVPLTANTGLTGLRIRTISPIFGDVMGSGDACTGPYETGETEDYIISIDTTYPCAGVPVAGTTSGPDSVCASDTFTLTSIGVTIATGLTYQWLSGASGSSFTAIAGATNQTYTIYSQAATTYYALVVTCTASGMTDTSIKYAVNELPFYRCYCDSASLGGTPYYAPIDSVAIAGTTLDNYTPDNPYTYSSYPAAGSTTATLTQGGYYTIVVNSNGFDAATSSMWIDYNHSGTYDAAEWTLVGSDIPGTASVTFNVPSTALTGLTGMRIRTIDPDFESMGAYDACTDFESGETEDYLITIDTAYPCTGTPTAGSISGPDSICNSNMFTLNLTGYSTTAGITFQWQSRPAGTGSFTPIAAANMPVYTSAGITANTDYNVVVTCTGSGLSSTSATFTVNLSSFFTCYCSPVTGTTLVYEGEDAMMTAKIAGTTFDATGMSVSSTAGYEQIPPTLASNTATFYQGDIYVYTITIDSMYYYVSGVGAWIDYNHNGIYDADEFVVLNPYSSGYAGTFTGNTTIPVSSLTGETGMRIETGEDGVYGADACENLEYGEVVDFIVTILSDNAVSSLGNTDFSVKAFPNPVNKLVTIQTFGTPGNNRSIILTDITGRVIEKLSMDTNQTVVDMGSLDAGIYLVKYEDDIHATVIKINKE